MSVGFVFKFKITLLMSLNVAFKKFLAFCIRKQQSTRLVSPQVVGSTGGRGTAIL